jgi:hypothetical protein
VRTFFMCKLTVWPKCLFKRINQIKAAIVKVLNIAGCKYKMIDQCNCGDLSVGKAHGPTDFFFVSHYFGINMCSSGVKVKYPGFKSLGNELFKTVLQNSTALSVSQDTQALFDFGNTYRCNEEVGTGLPI